MSLSKAAPQQNSPQAHGAPGVQSWMLLGAQSDAGPADAWGLPHRTSPCPGTSAGCPSGQGLLLSHEMEGEGAFYFLRTELTSLFIPL